MRRIAMLIGTVLGVAIGGVIATTMLIDTTAQEERVIPVRVSKFSESDSIEVGDSCSMSRDISMIHTDHQIVVTDEAGDIVALLDLDGGSWEESPSGLGFQCVIDRDLEVPEASFYTVYLGDERIVGYAASDFPIDAFEEAWINLD